VVYSTYTAGAAGTRRMICSELVARAFAEAETGAPLALDVRLWPTLNLLDDGSTDFRMDFTTPTMLALSPSLQRLNV
jgi:hypothetical protein